MTLGYLSGGPFVGELAFPLTREDRLWSGRMLVGEEGASPRGGAAAYRDALSTVMRRLVSYQASRFERSGTLAWDSLTELIVGTAGGKSGFSQPVAFQWRNRGSEAQRARRRRIRELAWSDLPATVRAVADELLTGRVPMTAGDAMNFAHRDLAATFRAENAGYEYVSSPAANVLLSSPYARRMRPKAAVVPATGIGSTAGSLCERVASAFRRGRQPTGQGKT